MSDTIPGLWQPESVEEWALYESLLNETSAAHGEGVSRERIVGAMLYVANVINLHEDREEAGEAVGPEEVVTPCPDCGEPVVKVHASLGGMYVVEHGEGGPCSVPMEDHPELEDYRD